MVNHQRVRRLLRKMGLEAIYPKRQTSFSHPFHEKYPYLLRGVLVEPPNQVWFADITYIRLERGFVYSLVIMDWHSRYVLSWDISITINADFCVSSLKLALKSARPEIFNTDQGVQFISVDFTSTLEGSGVKISMDGRGRVYDNIFIVRLWRSVKYEEVYLHDYLTVMDARRGLERYFTFYNSERLHESLGYKTPHEVYFGDSNKKQKKSHRAT